MLNDNTPHDEITCNGRTLIIDTSVIGGGPGCMTTYETMAMWAEDCMDIDCARTHDPDEALANHAAMLAKYTTPPAEKTTPKAPAPLTGKYAKLRDDLLAAYAETEHIEQTEDGGTCNFDAPVLHLDRWDGNKIKQAAKEAGGSAFKWTWGGSVMGWVFSPRSSGQANRRSRRAEAISEALKAKGYNAGMYYAMD